MEEMINWETYSESALKVELIFVSLWVEVRYATTHVAPSLAGDQGF